MLQRPVQSGFDRSFTPSQRLGHLGDGQPDEEPERDHNVVLVLAEPVGTDVAAGAAVGIGAGVGVG